MKRVKDAFSVARESPSCAILCNHWVSDVVWTSAINATAKDVITTTMLFNKTMSRYFMDLELFEMNSSGVFRVFHHMIHFYYVTSPHGSIRQPDMTLEWFQDTMNFCSTFTFASEQDNNNTPADPREVSLPSDDANRHHWKPDPSTIISTKRTPCKPTRLFNNETFDYSRKRESAKKGIRNRHDKNVLEMVEEKINQNNELLRQLISTQALKHKKEEEMKKADTCKTLRNMGKRLVGKQTLQIQASHLIEQVLKAYELDDLPKTIVQKYYGKQFPAWKVGMAMDRHVGALNFQGVDSIRSVQELEKYARGIIPSCSTIRRCFNKLEEEMLKHVKVKRWIDETTKSEVASLDLEQLLRLLIRHYGLEQDAREGPIEVAITMDGATFTKDVGHVTIGLKMVDARAVNPVTKVPLFENNAGYQSVDYCFPFRTAIASESDIILASVFAECYHFMRKVGMEGLKGINGDFDIMPIRVIAPHDGKACIEVMGRGGGAKVTEHFCPYCSIGSSQLLHVFTDKDLMCDHCRRRGKTHCRHWPVEDEAYLVEIKTKLESITNGAEEHYSLSAQFKENVNVRPLKVDKAIVNYGQNIEHLFYDYTTVDSRRRRMFYGLLKHHVSMRFNCGCTKQCPIDLNVNPVNDDCVKNELQIMVGFLQECTVEEQVVLTITKKINRNKETNSLLNVESMIIDIMHLINRTIERLIRILLEHGLNLWDRRHGDFFESVEALVNSTGIDHQDDGVGLDIVNMSIQRNLWTCPRGEAGKYDIGEVKMSEQAAKKFLDSIEKLYPVCLPQDIDPDRETFMECIDLFKRIVSTLQKKEAFSDEEIINLQTVIDLHSDYWVQLAAIDGQTNYYHYLSSGHVTYYFRAKIKLGTEVRTPLFVP